MEKESYFETLIPIGRITEPHFSKTKIFTVTEAIISNLTRFMSRWKSHKLSIFSRCFLGAFKDTDQLHKLYNV